MSFGQLRGAAETGSAGARRGSAVARAMPAMAHMASRVVRTMAHVASRIIRTVLGKGGAGKRCGGDRGDEGGDEDLLHGCLLMRGEFRDCSDYAGPGVVFPRINKKYDDQQKKSKRRVLSWRSPLDA